MKKELLQQMVEKSKPGKNVNAKIILYGSKGGEKSIIGINYKSRQ